MNQAAFKTKSWQSSRNYIRYTRRWKESSELENQQEDDIYKGCIDTKAGISKQSTVKLMKMIWKLLLGRKWVQIEKYEIEKIDAALTRFSNCNELLKDDFNIPLNKDQIYPRVDQTLKKRCIRQRLSASENSYLWSN